MRDGEKSVLEGERFPAAGVKSMLALTLASLTITRSFVVAMSYTDLHLDASAGARLDSLGWASDDAFVRMSIPPVARGQNLVATVPPTPAYLAPILAALCGARAEAPDGITLVLSPSESLPEWAYLLDTLDPDSVLRPLLALGPGQASRRFHASDRPRPNFLVLSPATALDLRRRSLLTSDSISSVLLAWPEQWDDDAYLVEIMSELDREAQRVVVTSSAEEMRAVVERYAWRAMSVEVGSGTTPLGPVRTVSVPWFRRTGILGELAEVLDPKSLAVWTADTSHHRAIQGATTGLGVPVEVTSGTPGPSSLIIAFDPPTPHRLQELLELGSVVLLVPPGTERYVRRLASPREPITMPSELDAATGRAARRRAMVERVLRGGEEGLAQGFLTLGPLFEDYEPSAVAAAIYALWADEKKPARVASAPAPTGVTRLWVGIGRKDEAGPNDIVGLLANELRVERSHIGKIELRETYSLVEVPADEAERIAQAMTGRVVRKRRIVARIDTPRSRPAKGRSSPPRGPRE